MIDRVSYDAVKGARPTVIVLRIRKAHGHYCLGSSAGEDDPDLMVLVSVMESCPTSAAWRLGKTRRSPAEAVVVSTTPSCTGEKDGIA
jgi:hypothetical protein